MSSDRFGGRAGQIAHFSSTKSVIFICDFLLDLAVFKDPESCFEPQNERVLGLGRVQYIVRRLLADPANFAVKINLLASPEQMLHAGTHGRTERLCFGPGYREYQIKISN